MRQAFGRIYRSKLNLEFSEYWAGLETVIKCCLYISGKSALHSRAFTAPSKEVLALGLKPVNNFNICFVNSKAIQICNEWKQKVPINHKDHRYTYNTNHALFKFIYHCLNKFQTLIITERKPNNLRLYNHHL